MEKQSIPATLEVLTVRGPWDKCIRELEQTDVQPTTTEELFAARILDAHAKGDYKQSELCMSGSWVGEGLFYRRSGDILVASRDYNLLLKNPQQATADNSKGSEYFSNTREEKTLLERAERDPDEALKSGVLLLLRKDIPNAIPVSALDEHPYSRFLAKSQAKPYGELLHGAADIKEIPVYIVGADYAKKQKAAFGRALWVNDLISRSYLDGYSYYLHSNNGRVRGVRWMPAGQAAEVSRASAV